MKPGRTRAALAALLQAKGYDVKPEDLGAAGGVRRQDLYCYRWMWVSPEYPLVAICSHDTMTDCVRYGFTLDGSGMDIEANANHPRE